MNILLSAHAHDLDSAKLKQLKEILQITDQSQEVTILDTTKDPPDPCTFEEDPDPEICTQKRDTRYNTADMTDDFLAEMYDLAVQNTKQTAPSMVAIRSNTAPESEWRAPTYQDLQSREQTRSISTTVVTRVRSGTIHDSEKPIEWRYCFSRNNTFIHSIFGEVMGQKVFNFLYSKYVVFFIFMLSCLAPFGLDMKYSNDIIRFTYFTVAVPIQILYFIFHLLSVNKKCARLIMTRFEFWLKLFYGTQFCVGTVLYWDISTVIAISLGIVTFLSIMLLSLSDGLQFKTSMKIIFGVTASSYYTVAAGYYLFYHKPDPTVIIMIGY